MRCPSVCLSVTEGHRKQFDLEASVAVYLAMEHTKLKLGDLCERQSWYLPQVKALASWTDYTKNRRQWTLTYGGLQIAKQLDSR